MYSKYLYQLFKIGCILCFVFLSGRSYAVDPSELSSANVISYQSVAGTNRFLGVASYYNRISIYVVGDDGVVPVEVGENLVLNERHFLVAVGRLKVLSLQCSVMPLSVYVDSESFIAAATSDDTTCDVRLSDKSKLRMISPVLDQLRYVHLVAPLASLSKAIESSIVNLRHFFDVSWGWSVIVFAFLLKILMLPFTVYCSRLQRETDRTKSELSPVLADIKSQYKGEVAHNMVLNAHKELGVSPFYALSPLFATMIQIPILIAVFNALAEMPQFSGQSFLWISDLSTPDSYFRLQFSIPYFKDIVNITPLFMLFVTAMSTYCLRNNNLTRVDLKNQKRNLYLMGVVFFVLFYHFPSVMVLYWGVVNLIGFMQRQIFGV